MSHSKHKPIIARHIYSLAFILSPVITALTVLFAYKITHPDVLARFFIKWNDEAAYYSLIKTMIEYGNPLGYWAYDGIHAAIGTGGPWGMAILMPYALLGKIFGFGMSAPVYFNILFLSISLLIFLRCTRPDIKDLKWLAFAPYIFIPMILYTTTAMTEPLRYALVIILSGQLIALANRACGRIFTYVIIPLTIIFSMQIYIFLGIFIPVYVFLAARNQKILKKSLYAAIASLAVLAPSFYLLKLTACTYSFKDAETIRSHFAIGFLNGLKYLLLLVINESKEFISIKSLEYGKIFVWHTYAYLALTAISACAVIYALAKKRGRALFSLYLMPLFILTTFAIGYFVIYPSSDPTMTVFRLMSIPMLFAILLLLFAGGKAVRISVAAICAIGLLCLPKSDADFLSGRFISAKQWEEYRALEQSLEERVSIKKSADDAAKEADRLKNTIAVYMIYSLEPHIICALPAGAGVNMMMSEIFDDSSGYLLFDKNNKLSQYVMTQNADTLLKEYAPVYEAYNFILYKKLYK